MRRRAVVVAIALGACVAGPPPPRRAETAVVAALRPIVVEYFALRRAANLGVDPSALHRRFPALATGEDRERGINIEAWEIANLTPVERLEYDIEGYEPLAAWLHEDGSVEVVVHGLDRTDARGSGEFKKSLYLEDRSGEWELVRTDEVTLPEYPHQTPSPRP